MKGLHNRSSILSGSGHAVRGVTPLDSRFSYATMSSCAEFDFLSGGVGTSIKGSTSINYRFYPSSTGFVPTSFAVLSGIPLPDLMEGRLNAEDMNHYEIEYHTC